MDNSKIIEKAKEYTKYFKTSERGNGDKFIHLTDEAPQELNDLCRLAHQVDDVMPNDYVYEFISDSLYLIAEADVEIDLEELIQEIEPDVYNHDLLKWVSNNLSFSYWVDQALETYGSKDLFGALQLGQKLHREAIAHKVLEIIETNIGE